MADGSADPRSPSPVDRVLSRLNALPEPLMRLASLAEEVAAASDEEAVELLAALIERAALRPSRDHRGALALIPGDELASRLGYERVAKLYRLARFRELTDVCQLFLAGAGKAADESVLLQPPRGETLTLGERRALARRLPRQQIERLLRDPDPNVVENLLNNPVMTEREVLRVASRRPVHPDVLMRVFAHRKWSNRYRVRKALIYNPNTPIQVALTLVTFLQGQDLRALARDPGVHAWIRDRAKLVLGKRKHHRGGSAAVPDAASQPVNVPEEPQDQTGETETKPDQDLGLDESGGGAEDDESS